MQAAPQAVSYAAPAAGAPVPPQPLTTGMPDPATIAKQKAAYSKMLDDQLKQGKDVLDQQVKYQKEYLAAQAEQQKGTFLMQLEQQVKSTEFSLQQQYSEQLMEMQQQMQKEMEKYAAAMPQQPMMMQQ